MKEALLVVLRYWHTLRYLRCIQIVGRIQHVFRQLTVDCSVAGATRTITRQWILPARRRQGMLARQSFCFLNETHEIITSADWNNPRLAKLWLYNLHYFDDLTATDADQRVDWHCALIQRWIDENPPGLGNGWEPYPLSLRIVNWVKWALSGHQLLYEWQHSLAVQVRYLAQNLETHLLGNHLFANAKALLFAGLFFEGNEAQGWYETGCALVVKELQEQVLADGGNFELSPMYHMIFLEDLLDLVNIHRAFGQHLPKGLEGQITPMLNWLAVMCHPDGEISFFNDAAIGVTPSVCEMQRYKTELLGGDQIGFENTQGNNFHFIDLPVSGYSRVQMGSSVTLIDRAAIGPDYLPGHAHADSLSFELSLFGVRVIVNSGTSVYGAGVDRQQQRGTAAHSTVVIDEQNSSEVWAGFRVARRARIVARHENQNKKMIRLSACHDGYKRLPGKPMHCREWVIEESMLTINDNIIGSGTHMVMSVLPLHPDIEIKMIEKNQAFLNVRGNEVVITIEGNGELDTAMSHFHPEFGISLQNSQLIFRSNEMLPIKIKTRINW